MSIRYHILLCLFRSVHIHAIVVNAIAIWNREDSINAVQKFNKAAIVHITRIIRSNDHSSNCIDKICDCYHVFEVYQQLKNYW